MADLIDREAARNDPKEEKPTTENHLKPPLKKAVYHNTLGRGAVRVRKGQENGETKQTTKQLDGKGLWSYWNSTFGSLKGTTFANRENAARTEPNEQTADLANLGDKRQCELCRVKGEKGEQGRLLFYERDRWLHVNCVLWNTTVVELKVILEKKILKIFGRKFGTEYF